MLKHKKLPQFVIYVLIVWSLMVSYMIYFSYKEAIQAGYGKTSIILLIGVVLVWSLPIYVKSLIMYKKCRDR